MRRPDPGVILLLSYLAAIIATLTLGSLLMGCKPDRPCVSYIKENCRIEIQRTATQPRFCTGGFEGGGDRPCWAPVEVCDYRCVRVQPQPRR